MSRLVLDSGGLSRLAERSQASVALIRALVSQGLWPPTVPTMVLIESLQGDAGRDAFTNLFLKTSTIAPRVGAETARRAAALRTLAGRGSAVDALVVALAEPGGTILTGDRHDIEALAAHARHVGVEAV